MLVHARWPVSTDALIEAAWAGELPRDPAKALHTVISRLRAVLGREAIAMGPAGYRLIDATVDAIEFEEIVDQARASEPPQDCDLLGRGLALWRGPAYGEFARAPFALAAGQHLEQLRMDAIEVRAAALIQLSEAGAAIPPLAELVTEQPFREYAVELLVTALYQVGRQTEALDRLRAHRARLGAELGLDPTPNLAALENRILGHALRVPEAGVVPAWLDTSARLIGRTDELVELITAVASSRVTALTGPGGVGKSRLAAEALGELHQRLGLPIKVVELAPVATGRANAALAHELELRPGTDSVTDEIVEYLTAMPHLLVLDNCEHLLAEIASLATRITRRCPQVRILVTSRRRLGMASEQVLPLEPLGLPDPSTTAGRQAATASVSLFGDRLRRLRPRFALTTSNTTQIAELCRRCDGVPLALELAASRTASSSVDAVLKHLPSDAGAESTALWRVVNWSYRLLDPDQQTLLNCLSVFVGDFTSEAAAELMTLLPWWSGDVTGALAELVESSLVVHLETASGTRHRLLEMVRVFATGQLEGSGRAAELAQAHGRWVRAVVMGIRDDWSRLDGALVAGRLTGISPEVGSALRRSLAAGQVLLASEIAHAVARCLHWTPSMDLRDLIIEVGRRAATDPGPELAGAIAAAAFSIAERGDPAGAQELGTLALAVSEDDDSASIAVLALAISAMYTGDLGGSARWFQRLAGFAMMGGEANASLALIACYRDDLPQAREHVGIALAVAPLGCEASAAFTHYTAGEVEARTDPTGGSRLLAQAATEADRISAEQVGRVSRVALFALLVRAGRRHEAIGLGLRVFPELRRVGAWTQIWTLLRMVAELLVETGRWSDAAFFLSAVQGCAAAPPPVGQDIQRYHQLDCRLSAHLGPHVLDQIHSLAATAPRIQVLSRVEQVLGELHDG